MIVESLKRAKSCFHEVATLFGYVKKGPDNGVILLNSSDLFKMTGLLLVVVVIECGAVRIWKHYAKESKWERLKRKILNFIKPKKSNRKIFNACLITLGIVGSCCVCCLMLR
ncbi:uncharacterized protein LOC133176572 [Saccostrea echinata]|uniref:uncharacterized protein LOC133176572 n=1 Tax=Saccostrea echinata TaxID=191078 RepID=UPI002A836597|nr:uncharacterized protein LOC133176572 [Saccostrea echinata]